MLKAMIFDFDGVICDSEMYHVEVWSDFFQSEGFHIAKEEIYPCIGASAMLDVWRVIYDRHQDDIPYSYQEYRSKMREYFYQHDFDKNYIELMYPEMPRFFKWLKKHGIKIGVASSSAEHYMQIHLKECGLFEYVDVIVTGYMFKVSKPHPEIYLTTMKMLGVDANETVIMEDSTYGIQAAKAAGALTIARKEHVFNLDQKEADYRVDSAEEIIELLKELKMI